MGRHRKPGKGKWVILMIAPWVVFALKEPVFWSLLILAAGFALAIVASYHVMKGAFREDQMPRARYASTRAPRHRRPQKRTEGWGKVLKPGAPPRHALAYA